MEIIFIASEFAPVAKVGGLGDVVGGLSEALAKKGHSVNVIIPFYDSLLNISKNKLTLSNELYTFSISDISFGFRVWNAHFNKVQLSLIEPTGSVNFFKRNHIYGEKDDNLRFSFFVKSAFEYLLFLKTPIDILHLNDWMSSIAAPLYKEEYSHKQLVIKKIVTTIHNIKHQGVMHPDELKSIGINVSKFSLCKQIQQDNKPKKINLLKAGIVYSDFITTVSPSYCDEIITDKGFGLEKTIKNNLCKIQGILNGIDTNYWNPQTDPLIQFKFPRDVYDLKKVVDAKNNNKTFITEKFGLSSKKNLLFCCISRLVEQKGPLLILEAAEYILKKGGKFILIGSSFEPDTKKLFFDFQEKHKNNSSTYCHFKFDEKLAHQCYAASDYIIVPSLFEPCGLTQLIAMRYGTIPIVHSVGGLKDTVIDGEAAANGTGYTFNVPRKKALKNAINRAFKDGVDNKEKTAMLLNNCLKNDCSWLVSARKYIDLYENLIKKNDN